MLRQREGKEGEHDLAHPHCILMGWNGLPMALAWDANRALNDKLL